MKRKSEYRVFLSGASREVGSYRRELTRVLHRKGLEVRAQEYFTQGPATLLERIRDYIAECDAVVFLVGERCGTFPTEHELINGDCNHLLSPIKRCCPYSSV